MTTMIKKRITGTAALALLLAVGGCAVGPDFQKPEAPATRSYTAEPLPAQTTSAPGIAGEAQRFVEGQDVPAQWWRVFGSDALDELVASALRANPDLQAAQAALRAAQEGVAAQRGEALPKLDLQFTPTRQRVANPLASPAESGASLYTLHSAQLNISYVPDVFGANRRQVEALTAQADVQRFQREAVYITLTTNIVNAAIQEASLRAQCQATRDLIALSTQLLDITRRQHAAGQLGGIEVAAQESALAQAEAVLPGLEKQLAQQRHLLAVLGGRLPSEDVAPRFELASLVLPQELPLSLPSRLVEQRPDIRAAQAQLHAASAQVGVATAARLPSLMLTANVGSSALALSQLLGSGTGFWFIGGGLAQPIFHGGTLLHQQRAAEASYEQAAAQYRSTVLTAFQNTADTLQAIVSDAQTLRAAAAAEAASRKSLGYARRQRELGAGGAAELILAQQTHQQAASTLIQAQASRFTDAVALFQSLGGGWWNVAAADAPH